jgi:hypothetical protein
LWAANRNGSQIEGRCILRKCGSALTFTSHSTVRVAGLIGGTAGGRLLPQARNAVASPSRLRINQSLTFKPRESSASGFHKSCSRGGDDVISKQVG